MISGHIGGGPLFKLFEQGLVGFWRHKVLSKDMNMCEVILTKFQVRGDRKINHLAKPANLPIPAQAHWAAPH